MKFALNYSQPASELLDLGEIEVDLFKCPSWPDLIASAREQRPVYVHFDLAAGISQMEAVDWPMISRTLAETGTRYVNIHLRTCRAAFSETNPDHGDLVQVERAIQAMLADVRMLADRFGPERVIVENLPYPMREGEFMRVASDPAVITRILDETGCGFLFDISHACITAKNLGIDLRDHLRQFPLERAREVHLTGIDFLDGEGWTDHLSMRGEDWDILNWVLGILPVDPEILAFEYGGFGPIFEWRNEKKVIQEQVPKIVKAVRNFHK